MDFDVVQVDYSEMAHAVAPLLGGLPTVFVCHESAAVFAARAGEGSQAVRRAAAWEARTMRRFDQLVCLSDRDAQALAGLGVKTPTTVIPSAVEVEAWVRDGAPQEHTVLFVGSFRHAPNVDAVEWLLDAVFPALRAELPTAALRIVGANPPEGLVGRAPDGVTFCGFVEDLAEAVAAASCVVVPVRQGGGLRGKVLEAWAAGRAVVGTPVAFEGIAGVSGQHWLEAAEPAELASHLRTVLTDAGLRDRLARAGRDLVSSAHGLQAQADAYEAVYRRAMGAR